MSAQKAMAIDDDTSSPTPSSSSTIYNRSQTNPQQSSPTNNTSNTNNNKPVSLDYIQSIRANFQSLDDVILQTFTSKDSSSTSGAVQSPSDNYKVSSLASVSSSQLAAIGSINGTNNKNNDDDDKVFVEDRRQNTLSAKKKEALLADPKALGEEVYIKYLRNKTMINLMEDTLMPKEISKNIIDTFERQDKNHLKGNVLKYLMKNNMRLLIECLDEFV